MNRIVRTITINAPRLSILQAIRDPWNVVRIWPDLLRLDAVERLAPGKWRFRWTRKFMGVRFEGLTEMVVLPSDTGILCETSGGLNVFSMWALDPEQDQTVVSLYVDYAIPSALIRKHSLQSIDQAFATDTERMLLNLKALVEETPEAKPAAVAESGEESSVTQSEPVPV